MRVLRRVSSVSQFGFVLQGLQRSSTPGKIYHMSGMLPSCTGNCSTYLCLVWLDGRDAGPDGVPRVLHRPAGAKLALRNAHDARHRLCRLDRRLINIWDLPRPCFGVLSCDIHLQHRCFT